MAKYVIVKDYNNIVTGVRFFKDEVVEGVPSSFSKLSFSKLYVDVTKDGKTSKLADKFEILKVDDATPLKSASPQVVAEAIKTESKMSALAGIGTLAGLGFAFYKKTGFWGYVGYGLLGTIAAGLIINVVKKK